MKHFQLPLCFFALLGYPVLLFGQDLNKEVSDLTNQIVTAVDQTEVKTIATLDFVDLQGNTSQLGRFLADEISTEMVMIKKRFAVVDRANLKKIMQENKLTVSGLVDPDNAKKLGQIAGVDAIVTGTVTPFDKSVRVAIKVIATDTAKIIAAARGEITKTVSIEKLVGQEIAAEESTGQPTAESDGTQAKRPTTQLGDLQVQLQSLKKLRQELHVILTLTNTGKKPFFVFAGDPEEPVYGRIVQRLAANASDDVGNAYQLAAVQGFTRAEDSYFDRTNQFVELSPKESASVTFTLRDRGNHKDRTTKANLNIEFAIVHDLKAKGSHRTKALVLNEQKLD